MRMTATKYCFLILLANLLMFLVAWSLAGANDNVEREYSIEIINEYEIAQ